MKVLFLHSNNEDYLNQGILHGLRSLLGVNCVDIPRYDCAYNTISQEQKERLRGHGFSMYGLMEELPELTARRSKWEQEIENYNLIVIADISFLWRKALYFRKNTNIRIAILDGSDSPALFPYESILQNVKKHSMSFINSFHSFLYFKRELIPEKNSGTLANYFPRRVLKSINKRYRLLPTSFCFPAEKITRVSAADKVKDFSMQIIDDEVSKEINGAIFNPVGANQYAFKTERDYYHDLQQSRFGITGKRGGWDCLRHYEMAANGCVLCFKDLDLKPLLCAPHGITDQNCISYKGFKDLQLKLSHLNIEEYAKLLSVTYNWIEKNTTTSRANQLLQACV